MKKAAVLLFLALPAAAGPLGGHDLSTATIRPVPTAPEDRATILEEMWQRHLLAPDQRAWSPQDEEFLRRIRRSEEDALELLRRKFGGYRPWVVKSRAAGEAGVPRLTKEGFEKYRVALTQEALVYFESKGADAKWAFKLRDWDGRPLFDGRGLITEAGESVYKRARLNMEVFWRAANGEVYGTRPPSQAPAATPPR